MLYINNYEYKILMNEIRYVDSTVNKIKGYSILIDMSIELNNVKGYINIWVDFFNNNNYKNIENKIYEEIPTDLESRISMIEIYDTENFVDFIDSTIRLEFGNIVNNQIETKIYIDDEYIKLIFNGNLKIKNE